MRVYVCVRASFGCAERQLHIPEGFSSAFLLRLHCAVGTQEVGFSANRITFLEAPIRQTGAQSTLTARAASNATIVSEISDCSIIPALAQRESAAVSVGEKAVLVLNARKR